MSCTKFSYYFILLVVLTLEIVKCKNKNSHSESQDSLILNDPAFKNINDSINKFPGDASIFLRRAIRLTQQNAHELAYSDFQKAWSLQPSLEIALPFAANLEILGRLGERLSLLESLNRQFPSNTQIGRLLADTYAVSGRSDQALMIYNGMIAKDSMDPETYYEKAMLLETLKDTIHAIKALQKAYSFQGVDTYGLELANLYAEQKNPKALEICDYILKHDSARILIDPFFIKGIFYANVKQYPKAIAQFDSCILRDWKTTDAYLEKGRVFFQMKNFNEAIKTFNMAITVTSTDPDAYYWLGRSYEAQNRKMEAINNYRKAISLDKNFTEAKQRLEVLDTEFAHP
ncbi:MAG TPA: tetratricopeptide repeat protein [Puia sp.]|jgi:tetratricopeptide (TPR) repeat protein|nr:tetratricopeptide repeat protein [Puia sp.]